MALAVPAGVVSAEPIAVRGGTLVDVRSGKLVPDVVVVVDGDRIVSVTPGGTVPAGAKVVEAKGKYILPGFIDLHVHYDEWAAELYLNHGVTTVVDLANVYEWIKAQKEGIEAGVVPGPRMFHSPPALDGASLDEDGSSGFTKRVSRAFTGVEDARAAMREYMADGVKAVKVYDKLTVEQLRGIVAEADKGDIPVIGHFPNVRVAAEVGGDGIEHIGAVANSILDQAARAEAVKKFRKGFRPPAESFMDVSKIPEITKFMVDKGLYLNPTLRMSWQGDRSLREKGFHYEDFDLTFNDWRLRYVPLGFRLANLKEFYEVGVWHWNDLSPYEQEVYHRGYENAQKVVKAFFDAGGKLYAGTDSAHMAVPGLALHQELELLVDAGVTPLAALQAATINPATLMRMADRLGTLEAGKAGDMVILDANPLEDIRNTRKISLVISRGKALDMQYHPNFKNPIARNYPEDSSHYFPSPEIQSTAPLSVEAESTGVVLTIKGTGFIPYSLVNFNGTRLQPEYVDGNTLRLLLPPALLKAGTHPLTVENPDFGWGSVSVGGHLAHLGIREPVSNEGFLLVGVKKGPAAAKSTP
jgi:imidazolonepropionase-like amidohydrolase